nr:TPA_asm: polymerase [Erythranthe ophiovirus]
MAFNSINISNYPNIFFLFSRYKKDFEDLEKSIKKEKEMEAKEVTVDYIQMIVDLEKVDATSLMKDPKVGIPVLITKIDSPHKIISPENLQMLKGNDYPKKWRQKNRIDLMIFREFFIGKEDAFFKTYKSTQDSSYVLVSKLRSYSRPSSESNIFWKFGESIMNMEKSKLSLMFLDKELSTDMSKKKETTLSENTMRTYWILDIFETINKNIMMNASAIEKGREFSKSVDFYEGKRINTSYYRIGASITHVEFENEETSLYIFMSSTISAYFFTDSVVVHVGRPELLQNSVFIADNLLTMDVYSDVYATYSEEMFINYYKELLSMSSEKRMGLAGTFEATCLLMSDYKNSSAAMPILDNVMESMSISIEMTEKLLMACNRSDGETCIRMSSLAKTLIIAETDPKRGLEKYTMRTNRDHPVSNPLVERLRSLLKMRLINSYISKHGRVPELTGVSEDLISHLELKAAKGNYNGSIVNEINNYETVKLRKFLEPGIEMNIQSRIIDKACTKELYDPEGNSEKEIQFYIQNDMSLMEDDTIYIDKSKYKSNDRIVKVLHREANELRNIPRKYGVRLAEKEKEQKVAARFFGIASFKLKLWLSSMMELVKRAMKLLPGQMMTMTDDERRDIMYKMSLKLEDKDCYSLFLDYSGHNTSQRPENTLFILEEIANMYGFYEGDKEYEEITSICYLFSNIHVYNEDTWSDFVYYSHGQYGAIEGWLGSLWGIQSQLMLEDMFSQMGIKDFIGTTYSDDSCGVFIQKEMDENKLNNLIKNVQDYGRKMGLLVKLSQTQVTNGRCSMLKEHYYKQSPVDMTFKKLFSISPNGPKMLGDQLESSTLIDSGYTSACSRSKDITIQTLLRNFRGVKLVGSSIMKITSELMEEKEFDPRYIKTLSNYKEMMKSSLRQFSNNKNSSKILIPSKRSDIIQFFNYHVNNLPVKEIFISIFYGTYTTYGYAMTPMPDSLISGYSLSNVKRIIYIQSLLTGERKRIFGSLVMFSGNACSYIDNSFPLVGGRKDTKLFTKDEIKKSLKRMVKNPELLRFINMGDDENEKEFRKELVFTFRNCFSSRIVSKFYEESLYSYINEIISKVDNATTMKMLLGGKKMMELVDKAWSVNHKLKVKKNTMPVISFSDLIMERDMKKKLINKDQEIKIKFLGIEEIPLMGKIKHLPYQNLIQPVYKGPTNLTEKGRKNNPPAKTFINVVKFDREMGIEGMFEHKLIFKAYDLVRYTKWLIMEQEKFSGGMDEEDEKILIMTCDKTLSTFSDAKYKDIEENVVCPKGGRYFHRALTAGFNPKTGDLSSNQVSSRYDIAGVDQLLTASGGADNNLNLQYLMIYVKTVLGILRPSPNELIPLGVTDDIMGELRDVSFKLTRLENPIGRLDNIVRMNFATKERIKSRGKLYYNYSSFISTDEDLKGKFVNHVHTMKEKMITMESSFRKVFSYMEDQMMVSPDLISDEIFNQLVPCEELNVNRDSFFDLFYKYYKSTNIIGKETPSRAVVRSMLYEELFKINSQDKAKMWVSEIAIKGFSLMYKRALIKLFIIATSMIYRLEDIGNGFIKLNINRKRTSQNAVKNYSMLRENECHFHIKDKRITEIILNSFPLLGYSYDEICNASDEIHDEIDGKVFEQFRMGDYYMKLFLNEIEKNETYIYGKVNYNSILIESIDLDDKLGINSAIKGFEMCCQLSVNPKNISSPTMSSVYPSAKGLITELKSNNFIESNDRIVELCGGRGDFHLAMMEENINHLTLSREDGYNLIQRIPGMKSKKVSFNCFKREDYIQYFDHDIILMDISHITNKTDCLSNIIGDLKINKKRVILRMNGLFKFFNDGVLAEISGYEKRIYIPDNNSPGYIFLTIDFRKEVEEKNESDVRGYHKSLLSSALTNSIGKTKISEVISKSGLKTKDHTHEIISDNTLLEMMIDEDPDYVHVHPDLKHEIKSYDDFKSHLYCYIDNSTVQSFRKNLLFPIKNILSKGDEGANSMYMIGKLDGRDDKEESIIVHQRFMKDNLVMIRGAEKMKIDDFVILTKNVLEGNFNNNVTKECWKLMLEVVKEESEINTEILSELINVQKINNVKNRSINHIYEIASQAVLAFKTNRVEMGLLRAGEINSLRRGTILKHKDKTTKYNILNYKLIMNRILYLSKIISDPVCWAGIPRKEYENLWSKHLKSMDEIERKELEEKIKSYKDIMSYLEEDNDSDIFSILSSGIERLNKDISLETIQIDVEDFEKRIDFIGFLDVTEEDIRKNQLTTVDMAIEEAGEDAWYEAMDEDDYCDE